MLIHPLLSCVLFFLSTVLLCFSFHGARTVQVRQRKLSAAMTSKKVRFTEIDGMDPEHKELRSQLFDLSGLRGKYPQVFIQNADGKHEFIGDWEEFEGLLDADGYPPEVCLKVPEHNVSLPVGSGVVACGH